VKRYLVDALDLGHNEKGVSRVLLSLVPRLLERSDEVLVACSNTGNELLGERLQGRAVVVSRPLQSKWEQWDLPWLARRHGVAAVYSHREAGALWGPPLLLHVPEDPEVRWQRDPPRSARDRARRMYSRLLLRRSLRHSAVVAVSTRAVARQLAAGYGIDLDSILLIPLGVDLELFRPSTHSAGDAVFHLGSSDPRDRTVLVAEAWALASRLSGSLPKLVIGGDLGHVAEAVRERADELGVTVELTGRLGDRELATRLRNAAVVVQPSSDEGFGLQPLEAMASGAPVVVTDAGAVRDVVGTAAVVCGAKASEIAEAMLYALANGPSLRPTARSRAEAYSWDASAAAVLAGLKAASHGVDPVDMD
jgi:glycosyltransferase involved in cell wall biosynthesis